MPQIVLETLNLEAAERRLCAETLALTGSIVGAAQILGITRHALKRRIIKLGIPYSRGPGQILPEPSPAP
jgi:transcriptional regulator with GAF, ATPase, and Fis domain